MEFGPRRQQRGSSFSRMVPTMASKKVESRLRFRAAYRPNAFCPPCTRGSSSALGSNTASMRPKLPRSGPPRIACANAWSCQVAGINVVNPGLNSKICVALARACSLLLPSATLLLTVPPGPKARPGLQGSGHLSMSHRSGQGCRPRSLVSSPLVSRR